MKVAVLIYGMHTAFELAVQSWKFMKEIDCDIYFSTWSYHKKYSEKLNYKSEYEVNKEMIIKYIPDINLIIHNEKDYKFESVIEKIVFHWKTCLKMMIENGTKYDIMILTRPENFMSYNFHSSEFYKNNSKDCVYGLENIQIVGLNKYFIQDIFFMGDFEVMFDLLSTMSTEISDLHGRLAEHIINKNLYVKPLKDIGVMTLRPNCMELIDKPINYDILWNKVQEWG